MCPNLRTLEMLNELSWSAVLGSFTNTYKLYVPVEYVLGWSRIPTTRNLHENFHVFLWESRLSLWKIYQIENISNFVEKEETCYAMWSRNLGTGELLSRLVHCTCFYTSYMRIHEVASELSFMNIIFRGNIRGNSPCTWQWLQLQIVLLAELTDITTLHPIEATSFIHYFIRCQNMLLSYSIW